MILNPYITIFLLVLLLVLLFIIIFYDARIASSLGEVNTAADLGVKNSEEILAQANVTAALVKEKKKEIDVNIAQLENTVKTIVGGVFNKGVICQACYYIIQGSQPNNWDVITAVCDYAQTHVVHCAPQGNRIAVRNPLNNY